MLLVYAANEEEEGQVTRLVEEEGLRRGRGQRGRKGRGLEQSQEGNEFVKGKRPWPM
jgi:hypothetical protein